VNWWRRNWWKTLGAAGVVGVAAGGVAVARKERHRRAMTPQEIRDRLHARYAAITTPASPDAGAQSRSTITGA
jgi:hypothetical protein